MPATIQIFPDRAARPISVGDVVICNSHSIDAPKGKGEAGVVTGFARFSKHHPQEAQVNNRWHWVSTLTVVEGCR